MEEAMAAGTGHAGQQGAPAAALRMEQPAAIVAEIAASRRRRRLRFRALFVLTWLVVVGGLAYVISTSGKSDFTLLTEGQPTWLQYILLGIPITLFVSVASIFLATAAALVGALGRLSIRAPIYALATLYVSMVRGTPLIVQIIFVYLALPQFGIVLPALAAGIFALGFNYGAYLTEIFRAGIQAVPRGQREAAAALGMTDGAIMRRIVLPQAIRIVIPAIGNDFISMTKDSALVSYVGIQELFWRAGTVGTRFFRSFETLLVAAMAYWVITIVLSFFQERLEQRMAESDRRI
jgi:polar amino acid transport system permease protein